MRRPHSIFVLFLLLVLGVSLVVPVEDVPETPYDESETLPYEGTPQSSIVVPESLAMAALLTCASSLGFGLADQRYQCRPDQRRCLRYQVSDSPIILDHSLRC